MSRIPEHDAEAELIEQVRQARSAGAALELRGGGSKAFYGNPVRADRVLGTGVHQGVVAYEPTELAVTVRAGTPLAALEALLAAHGQQLPFEPPHFGSGASVGGMVAAGLSGPRRPYAAAVRDAVLGVRLVNGEAQALEFGGRVMKNVAGYDLSRLMVGSLGVLGLLLEVSLKVMPAPAAQITRVYGQDLEPALAALQRWAGEALPVTGSAWRDGRLHLRLAGSDEGVAEAERRLGGEALSEPEADAFWRDLREQRLAFFGGAEPLWRVSVRPSAPAAAIPGTGLVEWGGALRWVRAGGQDERLRAAAKEVGGHATLFRPGSDGAVPAGGVFAPLDPVLLRLHRRLKRAFDPAGLFNPGRLYPEMDQARA